MKFCERMLEQKGCASRQLHEGQLLDRKMLIEIIKMRPEAQVPVYQHAGDAGFDLRILEAVQFLPGQTLLVGTGLAFAIPDGYEMQIRLRSSIAFKTPLIMPNSPGTIDSGYRGEVGIILRNLSHKAFELEKGSRVAQGIIAPVVRASFNVCAELSPTERGAGGFGSTGKT